MNSETPLETEEFMHAFDRSLLGLALILIVGPFRWLLYLDPWWKKAYAKVHAFVDVRVERALEKNRSPEKETDSPKRYVLLEEMAKQTQDPYDLRMQILNVFFPAPPGTPQPLDSQMQFSNLHDTLWSGQASKQK